MAQDCLRCPLQMAQEKFDGFFRDGRAPQVPASLAVIPFPGYQFAMPTKDGVGCEFLTAVLSA